MSADKTVLRLTEDCSFHEGLQNPSFAFSYTENFLIGVFKRSPDNTLSPCRHAHESYEFIVPISPITNLVAEKSVYIGEPHYIYPVQSGRTHGIKYSQSNVSYISIVIEKEFFEKMSYEIFSAKPEFNNKLPYSDALHDYIKNFRNEFNSNNMQNEYILKPLRNLICAEIIRSAFAEKQDARKSESAYASGISSVIQYIDENYHRDITVDELAKKCGLSKTYFAAQFRQVFGTSPKAYVNTLRIAKAKNMLEFSDLPIKKISVSCGFKSLNTFFCAFKKSTDMTPTEFKASRQQEFL